LRVSPPLSESDFLAWRRDLSLVPGEFAAYEGDERAIFAVLEGRIEAVKAVDGVERVVGERYPGDIFGEVPIMLGTVFPVGFRAAEKSRAMRIEPHDDHAVAAVVPDVGKELGKLAGHRMGGSRGLEGIAANRRRRERSWSSTWSCHSQVTAMLRRATWRP